MTKNNLNFSRNLRLARKEKKKKIKKINNTMNVLYKSTLLKRH